MKTVKSSTKLSTVELKQTTAELKDKDLPDINFVQYKSSKKPVIPRKKSSAISSTIINHC